MDDVAVDGNRAYISNGSLGFMILDITDLSNPTNLNEVDIRGNHISLLGNYAYVSRATTNDGLRYGILVIH